MNLTKKISVSEKEKKFLITRESAISLFNVVSKYDENLDLDFINVEFMSRSYADQFFKLKMEFEKKYGKQIQISNANEEIINMIQIVSKTQNLNNREYVKVPIFKFSKPELLTDYLLSI